MELSLLGSCGYHGEALARIEGGPEYITDSGFSQVVIALLGLAFLILYPLTGHSFSQASPPICSTCLKAGPLITRHLPWSSIILEMSSLSIAHYNSDNLEEGGR